MPLQRGVVFHLVKGSAYLLVVLRDFLASCTPVLWPFLHILCLSLIYIFIYIYDDDDVCLLHLPIHVLFIFSLYTHVSLCIQSLFLFHTWCLDEFCLSVLEKRLWKYILPWTLFLQNFSSVCSRDRFIY